jgi:hypothetical protein
MTRRATEMIDAYVSELPDSALGAIGGSLLAVGLSLVLGIAITIVALGVGALVQRALDRPRRRPASSWPWNGWARPTEPPERQALTFSLDSAGRIPLGEAAFASSTARRSIRNVDGASPKALGVVYPAGVGSGERE